MKSSKKEDKKEASLEKVMKDRINFLVEETMQKFLGVTISELNKDLSDKISRNPLLDYEINSSLSFKVAKKMFKKQFLSKLIKAHYGNISLVAKITGLNRRSIHRAVKELGIKIHKLRKEMLTPKYFKKETVDSILRHTLDNYKTILHPTKLQKMYENVETVTEDIITHLPELQMTWKQAEKEFEKEYLKKVLKNNNFNLTKTAKKIKLRYETLLRKMKKLEI